MAKWVQYPAPLKFDIDRYPTWRPKRVVTGDRLLWYLRWCTLLVFIFDIACLFEIYCVWYMWYDYRFFVSTFASTILFSLICSLVSCWTISLLFCNIFFFEIRYEACVILETYFISMFQFSLPRGFLPIYLCKQDTIIPVTFGCDMIWYSPGN